MKTHVAVAASLVTLVTLVALVAASASAAEIQGYVLEQEIVTRTPRADGTLREVVEHGLPRR